jgi:IS30 family transposase
MSSVNPNTPSSPSCRTRAADCARVLPLADRIEKITYDNGKLENSHVEIGTSLGSLSYFAKPYNSWERGLKEHTNGLFRQYFPKG